MMTIKIATHEFCYMFCSLQSLIVGGLFFGLAFLFTANGVEFQFAARGGLVFINSPYAITTFLVSMCLLAIFATPAYMANTVLKDFESGFDAILFSAPITKSRYLIGRFLGAYSALSLALLAAPVGLWLGTLWPWAVPETLTTNNISHYAIIYFGFVLPSMFTVSCVIFAVAAWSRSMIASYIAALSMLVLYLTVVHSGTVSDLFDPFMVELFYEQTRYWTAFERNNRLIGYSGVILANRALWLGIAVSFLAAAIRIFSFRTSSSVAKQSTQASTTSEIDDAGYQEHLCASDWRSGTHLKQCWYRTKFEILAVLKSRPFVVLMSFCFVLLFFAITGRETLYDVKSYPLTRLLLVAIMESLTVALMAVLAFYSADVVWRERSCSFDEIMDALPAPNWVFVVSKIVALAIVMHAIVLMGILIAISLQIFSGYHDLQIGLYVGRGLIYYPIAYVFLAVLTVFFQVLAKNRMLGIFCFVVFMSLLALSRDVFGFEHILISYGLPGIAAPLSDMNADSRFAAVGIWARVYWGSIAGLILLLIYVLWNRGVLQPLRLRLRNLRIFRTRGYALSVLALFALFVTSGLTIYTNTNVLNKYRTKRDIEDIKFTYEHKYRQFESLPMPRIVDVNMDVDIFPYRRRIDVQGTHILENKSGQEIHTVHITFPINAAVVMVELEGAVQISVDEECAYYIFNFDRAMLPGEQRRLAFVTRIQQRGFPNSEPDVTLVRKGTFIRNTQITPYIGFCPSIMLDDNKTRRRYGLQPLARLPKLEDIASHDTNMIRQDSDYVDFEVTVSTVVGQTAVSPGYLVNDWKEGGRHYFTYKMDAPMMNSYGFLSAEYEIVRDSWHDVQIEVFHHAPHSFNVPRMIAAVKDSLSYYSDAFSHYQYRQLRILEFPAYRKFAQSFPNTIPFSEDIGFVADVSDPRELDLPYFVTAHEVAHQWWAHQVMAANVQGGSMLIETLAQYSALMVLQQKLGKHQVRRFLKHELDRYLSGRAVDAVGEQPLFLVEDQDYIYYRKGSLIMYALQDYVGEEVINRALNRMLEAHAYRSKPYAISTDLIAYLKQEAGVEFHALIKDLFQEITIYDLSLKQATVAEMVDGRFKVTLRVDAAKYYADKQGNETKTPFDVAVDIGLFLRSPADSSFTDSDVIWLKKHPIDQDHSVIEIMVDQVPEFSGIDPYHKLIDRNSDDNLAAVENEVSLAGFRNLLGSADDLSLSGIDVSIE